MTFIFEHQIRVILHFLCMYCMYIIRKFNISQQFSNLINPTHFIDHIKFLSNKLINLQYSSYHIDLYVTIKIHFFTSYNNVDIFRAPCASFESRRFVHRISTNWQQGNRRKCRLPSMKVIN